MAYSKKDWIEMAYELVQMLYSVENNLLTFPIEKYIIQEARFDPAKGIPDLIESYGAFRSLLSKLSLDAEAPQLVM
jgi:hypothetical protein